MIIEMSLIPDNETLCGNRTFPNGMVAESWHSPPETAEAFCLRGGLVT
jgi:hypothetical protein